LGIIKKKMDENLAEDQFGFRKNRGTGEAIFVLAKYCREKFYSKQIIYIAFVDLLKAFNIVNWNVMMKTLKMIKIGYRVRRIIRELCKHHTTTINVKEGKREAAIRKGVMQVCKLSPFLFNIYIAKAKNECKEYCTGIKNTDAKVCS
jgi:hypothetical protein